MRECKLTVLSWRWFLTLHQSCVLIDIPVCSNRLTRLWAITREQPNIFATHITLGMAATCQMPSFAHFVVHIALVLYTLGMLFVDFSMFWLERLPMGSRFFPLRVASFKMWFPLCCNLHYCSKIGFRHYRYKHTKDVCSFIALQTNSKLYFAV